MNRTPAELALDALIRRGALLTIVGMHERRHVGAFVYQASRQRLLFAEAFAEHQGHVHVVEAATLEKVTFDMVNIYSGGALWGTVETMNDEEARRHQRDDWLKFISTPQSDAWVQWFFENIGKL